MEKIELRQNLQSDADQVDASRSDMVELWNMRNSMIVRLFSLQMRRYFGSVSRCRHESGFALDHSIWRSLKIFCAPRGFDVCSERGVVTVSESHTSGAAPTASTRGDDTSIPAPQKRPTP